LTEPKDLRPNDKTRANYIVDRVMMLDEPAAAAQLADVLENFVLAKRQDLVVARHLGDAPYHDPKLGTKVMLWSNSFFGLTKIRFARKRPPRSMVWYQPHGRYTRAGLRASVIPSGLRAATTALTSTRIASAVSSTTRRCRQLERSQRQYASSART
jgi:hypothetical protein